MCIRDRSKWYAIFETITTELEMLWAFARLVSFAQISCMSWSDWKSLCFSFENLQSCLHDGSLYFYIFPNWQMCRIVLQWSVFTDPMQCCTMYVWNFCMLQISQVNKRGINWWLVSVADWHRLKWLSVCQGWVQSPAMLSRLFAGNISVCALRLISQRSKRVWLSPL